jgi:hypothetical protein
MSVSNVESLQAFGVLHQASLEKLRASSHDPHATLCQPSNVSVEQLERYARAAIALFVPSLAKHPMVPGQLSLFDFSERWQSNRAAMLVPGAALGQQHEVLVTRVGDALQEPFWPEGLGINRGFLGALDCAHMVQRYAAVRRERPGDVEECLALREELFGLTKVLSGHNRKAELRDHLEGAGSTCGDLRGREYSRSSRGSDAEKGYCYTIQPHTRYLRWSSKAGLSAVAVPVPGRVSDRRPHSEPAADESAKANPLLTQSLSDSVRLQVSALSTLFG